jgi:putative ABC transport system substrate-binding protein
MNVALHFVRLVTIIALASAVGPCFAQPTSKTFRIGTLSPVSAAAGRQFEDAFIEGLREVGYIEGKNVVIERRYADGQMDRLPTLAAELIELKLDVLFAPATAAIRAAKQISSTTPMVFAVVPDPVGDGLVTSLGRPGGNVTGLSMISGELSAKRLELLSEVIPKVSRVALLHSGSAGATYQVVEAERAAKLLGKTLLLHEVKRPEDLLRAFTDMRAQHATALVVTENPMLFGIRIQVAELAVRNNFPTIFGTGAYVDAGGLMSYGASYTDLVRRAAFYVDKILKGAKPADLPVEQPTKFELVINLKIAKALGIKIPQSILLRADRVIE